MQNPGAGKTALGLDNNVGALLCYLGNLVCALGLIYSIVVIVTDKTNKLPRFHAFQSILLTVVSAVIGIAIQIIATVAVAADSGILAMLIGLVALVFWLAVLIAVIYTAVKAFQGNIFKLPVIGEMADKWSN
jgi:uncharacterized membrane protein